MIKTLLGDMSDFYTDVDESLAFKIFMTFVGLLSFVLLGFVLLLMLFGVLQLAYYYPVVTVPILLVVGVVCFFVVKVDRKARRNARRFS